MKGAASTRPTVTPSESQTDLFRFETYRDRSAANHSASHSLRVGTHPIIAKTWPFHPLRRADFFLACALFAAAILVRWPLIERGQTLLHPDEAVVGIMAQDIAAGERFPIYFYGQRYMGALEAYVIAAISAFVSNPIHALRLGPACFFTLLVAVQYLMLTRWFGREGGLAGAAVLLAGSPMFAQWSISARGGYIEVLLWGSLLLWAYSEWFVTQASSLKPQVSHRFLFGLLIGSGLWINPSILFFILPIVVHAVLNRARTVWTPSGSIMRPLEATISRLGITALPVAVLVIVLALNCIWSVCVDDGRIRTMVLLDLFRPSIAAVALAIGGIIVAVTLIRMTTLLPGARQLLKVNGMIILGAFIGASPCAVYLLQRILSGKALEPALPLGLRPMWETGETLVYFLHGLPLWFGADPTPFVDHVTVGRERTALPLDLIHSTLAASGDRVVLVAALTASVVFLLLYRRQLSSLLSLKPACYAPPLLLLIGAAGTILLYLLGGCTCSFTTIRYLLPLWAFLPGLVAAVWSGERYRFPGRWAAVCLCLAWGVGQVALHEQIGAPHPLSGLAAMISESGPRTAKAEILDAHLLSYLTNQRCRIREYDPFWPRLAHYERAAPSAPDDYIVNTREFDRTADWTDAGWPGPPPPETQRTLWPRLRRAMYFSPGLVVERKPLVAGFERIRLSRPID